jgi:hypothetical protein
MAGKHNLYAFWEVLLILCGLIVAVAIPIGLVLFTVAGFFAIIGI